MRVALSKPVSAVVLFLGCATFLVLTLQTRAGQRGPTPEQPAGAQRPAAPRGGQAGRGAGGGGAGGGRGATTFGDGPWDLGEGPNRMHVTVVTKGLDHPWGMQFLPNGDMLITERAGRLRVVRKGVLDPTPISGLPQIRALSLGGLMDIALHPKFAENRLIYFAYSKPGTDAIGIPTSETDGFEADPARATLAVGRAHWDGGPSITDFRDIFLAQPYYGGGRGTAQPQRCCGQGPADASYGSRLAFDKAGYLYITSGDRNYGEQSQNPESDIGKIIRLKDDGTIPPDNPFIGKAGYRPENLLMGTMTRSLLRETFDAQGKPASQERLLTELGQRFRDVREGPDGFVYLLTDETAGAVLKIEPGK